MRNENPVTIIDRLMLHVELLRWRVTLAYGNWRLGRLIRKARRRGSNLPNAAELMRRTPRR